MLMLIWFYMYVTYIFYLVHVSNKSMFFSPNYVLAYNKLQVKLPKKIVAHWKYPFEKNC